MVHPAADGGFPRIPCEYDEEGLGARTCVYPSEPVNPSPFVDWRVVCGLLPLIEVAVEGVTGIGRVDEVEEERDVNVVGLDVVGGER